MKSSIFSLAFVAVLGAAQTSDGVPSCARPCVNKFTSGSEIAGCAQLDVSCICKNQDFINSIACCLTNACDKAGQEAAVEYAKQICSAQGVATPDTVTCKQASGSTGSSTLAPTGTQASAGTQTSASARSTTTNAAPGLSGASGLMGAALAVLAVL